jgi:hypothetical protein
MQNFNSLASTQTDIAKFWTFFQENFRFFFSEFLKIPNLNIQLLFELAKHIHAKFQLSSFYPDGLRQIFDHFSSKFPIFLRKFQNFPILKKIQIEHRK